jgi:uncharacterized circularly permuted ATP-grasp superfamily protein/uncharacterized alpha-E superfamily protein
MAQHPSRDDASQDDLLAGYPYTEDRYDELFAAPQQPRPHWQKLYGELSGASHAAIGGRQQAAERQIQDSGVTYNVYADPRGFHRPWNLDVLPFLVSAEEWREIERGVIQRATLLDRLLGDLYGPQQLLKQGMIPPELIFSQSAFLRPAHGMVQPGGRHLHVYAADLARSPEGRWWVMADRTQAPSGAGYALENRLIVSRIFPSLFRDLRVQHLAQFFATLRDSLMHFAPRGDGPTLCVLLTPGPYNETYFEHSLLARYLGFPLVEGSDLTVRDGRVWLKTLGGLRRVHAILRRQDDSYCDPLEFRTDSALGVAGLADCARRGRVLIANPLGSGLLESGALLGFLPPLCEALLGESLQLPSIATWWCGEPAALEAVRARIDKLVFKATDPSDWFAPIFGQDLDDEGIARLDADLAARPQRYVAQELVRVSQAPVLDEQSPISARGVGLRVFAVATPGGYAVMPGGLTRVASGDDVRIMAMQRGGSSKDTWILSDHPVDAAFTLLHSTVTNAELVRSGATIPSRIAENLFWFGRYQERCDNEARLLREALNQSLQEDDDEAGAMRPILALARRFGILAADSPTDAGLLAAATARTARYSLPANLAALERLAHTLRDRISLDHMRTINRLQNDPVIDSRNATLSQALRWLDYTITNLTTLSGYTLDGMTRDDGWRFLSIGRRLERLSFQALAIQVAVSEGLDAGLTWLLRLSDSIVTYHARYMARPEWLPTLHLLIVDVANPRAIRFQTAGIQGYLEKFHRRYGDCACERFLALCQRLDNLAEDALRPGDGPLVDLLGDVHRESLDLSDRLSQRFFNLLQESTRAEFGL